MNKRKTDDEFARIGLSYINSAGEDIEVMCPESQSAAATLDPSRRDIHANDSDPVAQTSSAPASTKAVEVAPAESKSADPIEAPVLTEKHFTILYGDTGHTYESIIGPYLEGVSAVEIEEPYVRANHQIQNFVRFCEAVIKSPSVKKISLTTSYDRDTDVRSLAEKLDELKQSLLEVDVELQVSINEHLHDREIRLNNGWTIKIGRGLDFYQRPDSWYGIGSNDVSLRKCLETKVDIFK